MERGNDRVLQHQRFRLFAQGDFGFVILFQVEVAQFLVDLDEIVEILDVQVVSFPQVFHDRLLYEPCLFPALLQFAERVECLIERFVTVDQFFQFFDDLEFGLVVGFFFGVQPGDELIAFLAVFGE